ncbi:DUF4279 domain-containing protein [Pseudomarimonas salicorniae]|uniref:DUF4279 domain-containing protein n=1 Tax=Pseudomarimonas salicorniae TaxID=2933270 RepID=UPI003CCD98BF
MALGTVTAFKSARDLVGVGGPIGESSATLGVFGSSLDPKQVTTLIGVEPTESFRAGFRRGPRSPAMKHGAWFLEERGILPEGPTAALRRLRLRVPDSAQFWEQLRARYSVQVRLTLHLEEWSSGFSLSPDLVAWLNLLGVGLEMEIFSNGDTDA